MMSHTAKVIVLRTAGTNCDQETAYAFHQCGAEVDLVHISALLRRERTLADYHILAIPGGFTYGDDIASGRILANELRFHLAQDLEEFIFERRLIIGICNGFQVLVKTGILPGITTGPDQAISTLPRQTASLIENDSGKFEDRWTYLKCEGDSVWTRHLKPIVYFPVAHAEGKFVMDAQETFKVLEKNGQIAFRYCTAQGRHPTYPENPNGSLQHIAGITDPSGRILGLMPHPERHFWFRHHPFWTRLPEKLTIGDGAKIFANGVRYVEDHLL